ncbi:unnamed protein product [Calypogeia fissa]
MGKLRSGLRGWIEAQVESLSITIKSIFSRLAAGFHSLMDSEALTEREFGALLALISGGLLVSVIAAKWGVLLQFLVGLIIGGGMMAVWEQMMEKRSRERSIMASNVAVLGGATPTEGYERVEWLNRLLQKAWPYVVSATEFDRPTIRDCLEHMLEEYRLGLYQVIREQPDVQRVEKYIPTEEVINSIYINAISLGTTPPKFAGLKIHRLKNGNIFCYVKMEWQSTSQITLGVGADTGIVPIILENLKIITTARVLLRIMETPPLVAAISATIPVEHKPSVDFSLSVVGSPTTVLPIVTKQLRKLVENFIVDTVLWPHRFIRPIIPADKARELKDLYPTLHGQLSVAVMKGEHFVNLYPYVTIYCRPEFKVRTKSIENTHDPTWNEEFILNVEDQKTQSVTFLVLNENKGPDELVESEREAAGKEEEELIKVLTTPEEPGSYTKAIDLMHAY